MTYFPNTTDEVAARQMAKLDAAKQYLQDKGISATTVGSKFDYRQGATVLETKLVKQS